MRKKFGPPTSARAITRKQAQGKPRDTPPTTRSTAAAAPAKRAPASRKIAPPPPVSNADGSHTVAYNGKTYRVENGQIYNQTQVVNPGWRSNTGVRETRVDPNGPTGRKVLAQLATAMPPRGERSTGAALPRASARSRVSSDDPRRRS